MVPTSPTGVSIDQKKVDLALRLIELGGFGRRESELAGQLRNPTLTQDEKNCIVQTLARKEGGQKHFYGNDYARQGNSDSRALSEDEKVIADAVQAAYNTGAINKDDLLRIADFNASGNGAQRFQIILSNGTEARQPGGVGEVLADALWERGGNDGLDIAAAAIHYASSPELMSSNLDTPDKRAKAFEALIDFNEKNPAENLSLFSGRARHDIPLAAEGRIFIGNMKELVDRYTMVKTAANAEPGAKTEMLAKFMSQTLFNPDAKEIQLDGRHDLVSAIRGALAGVGDAYIQQAKQAPADSRGYSPVRTESLEQFGRLTAAVKGGAAVALTKYSDQIKESEESRASFASLLGAVAGDFSPKGGNTVATVVGRLVEKALTQWDESPERPDAAFATSLFNESQRRVKLLGEDLRVTVGPEFNAAHAAEVTQLESGLNVNLGGQHA